MIKTAGMAVGAAIVVVGCASALAVSGGGGPAGAVTREPGPAGAATYVPTPEPIPTLAPSEPTAPKATGFARDAAAIRSCPAGLLPFLDVETDGPTSNYATTALLAVTLARPGVAARLSTPFGTASGGPQWADLEDGTSLLVSEFKPGQWTATPADFDGCSEPGEAP